MPDGSHERGNRARPAGEPELRLSMIVRTGVPVSEVRTQASMLKFPVPKFRALALLKKMEIEFLPLPWREDARWTEYLALVARRQSKRAGESLEEMATWPGRIGDMARERKARTGH